MVWGGSPLVKVLFLEFDILTLGACYRFLALSSGRVFLHFISPVTALYFN